MEKENILDVSMFGGKGLFGGRETKLEAVVSRCKFSETCEALKQGRCAANNPMREVCESLETESVTGYTSRAKKYYSFKSKWESHEKYSAVKKGLRRFEYIGENRIRIQLSYIDVARAIHGHKGYSAMSTGEPFYIDRDIFNLEMLLNIMSSYSNSLLGGSLSKSSIHSKEEMLLAIKDLDIELYNKYIEATGHEISYIKKEAYIKTLKPNVSLTEGWYWDGEYLSRKLRTSVNCNLIRGFAYGEEVFIKPAEDSIIVIEDNTWVDEDTKFKG